MSAGEVEVEWHGQRFRAKVDRYGGALIIGGPIDEVQNEGERTMEQNEQIKQLAASLGETNAKLQKLGQFCVAQQKALELLGVAVAQHQAQIEELASGPAAVN